MSSVPCINDGRRVPPLRVLVVEDYAPFQRFICSTLATMPGMQIVGQASDGLEAIQKTEELQPDLILFDVELRRLNGIEAARRSRELSPQSKILFVSQESSADVVQEAFRVGALGYVSKADAGRELLPAVEAILQGRRFVSPRIAEPVPAALAEMHPSEPRPDWVFAPPLPQE